MSNQIFLTGDVHGDIDIRKLSSKKWPEGKKLNRSDFLIILGDAGILWSNYIDRQEKHLKDWYTNKKPWTTLFVCGNHENHHRLQNLPLIKKFGSVVGKVTDSIFYLRRGEIYNINGLSFFVMGGADSIDKHTRIEGSSWWREEIPSVEEMNYGIDNLSNHGWEVDYVLTHTIPEHIFYKDEMKKYQPRECPVTKYLDFISKKLTFKQWYCGHIHCEKDIGNYHILYDRILEI